MPTTNSTRMRVIANELWADGRYTHALSVEAITAERDALLARLASLEGGAEAAKEACGVALRHSDAISAVPPGFDTVLGYLAKFHPDVLDSFDYSVPTATARDGYWLRHRTTHHRVVEAPACLKAHGIETVNAWPVALLEKRWG